MNKRLIDYLETKLMCESLLLLSVPHRTTLTYQRINQAS